MPQGRLSCVRLPLITIDLLCQLVFLRMNKNFIVVSHGWFFTIGAHRRYSLRLHDSNLQSNAKKGDYFDLKNHFDDVSI